MNVKQFLDSTYLKTANQAGISESENQLVVQNAIQEAIDEDFKLIMIRPEYVALAKKMITSANSKVTIGTVIDFPMGNKDLDFKLVEAKLAIQNGADDLDFVLDYEAFKRGEVELVKNQVIACTKLGLEHHKIVKWIIEVSALTPDQIIQLTALVKNCVIANFKEAQYEKVFVKSSTGFYPTQNGLPNGATIQTITLMLENACPLPVKAAGGVRSYHEAVAMIKLGVKRIGTSAAKAIASGQTSKFEY
jgi:deoxyribose-phosphate aldolase